MLFMPEAILFACSFNSVRSPMAAALLRQLTDNRVYVESVGVRAGDPDGFMIEVMAEIGIDMSAHEAKTFEELDDSYFDLIISLSPEAQHSAVEMTRTMACELEFWMTFDPTYVEGSRETRLAAFRQVRDSLHLKLRERFMLFDK
ncbi:arsenate-mycothiol transferase ArsC [Kiloniella sp. b19]|uniref:arsenate-mycothiol transferase ArsC n=1 Tax=Kiloniella sp. GXU_MW_B19 TaxID=3141326 RepID=UPI0031E489FF